MSNEINISETKYRQMELDIIGIIDRNTIELKYDTYNKIININNIVDARPTAIEPLTVGDNFGIPNWLALKIDAITILSDFKIDGESFVRASGEKFEKVDSTEGLQVWRINLQSKENNYIPFKIFDNTFAYEFN